MSSSLLAYNIAILFYEIGVSKGNMILREEIESEYL